MMRDLPKSFHFAPELCILFLIAGTQRRGPLPFRSISGGSKIAGFALTAGKRIGVGVIGGSGVGCLVGYSGNIC